MKSVLAAAALITLATGTHAQKTYEQLNPAGRKFYDQCTESAASKPTSEGVRIAMAACNRRYLSGEPLKRPATTEAFAAAMAAQINEGAQGELRPKDALRMSAEAVGKQVIIRSTVPSELWLSDSPAQRQNFANFTRRGCETFSTLPEFKVGGLSITYIYDGDKGERLSNIVVSQKTCDSLRYQP